MRFIKAYPELHLKAALVLAVSLVIIITTLPAKEHDELDRVPFSLVIEHEKLKAESLPIEETPAPPEVLPRPDLQWKEVKIKPGDSLSAIFKRIGLPAADLMKIVRLEGDVSSLRKIIPGHRLNFQIEDGKLHALQYEESELVSLVVTRNGDEFSTYKNIRQPEVLTAFRSATISNESPSLYHAGKNAGLSDNIIMKLSYVFQWDISFALDLRQGDSFTLLYEEFYVEGERVKEGDILAAEFTNMGKTHTAVLYATEDGRKSYFAPDGRSMRKAFLRDPVHFSHVSSSFNLRRLHPIHKRAMPHRGIDYAANRGTPVVASGDGKVTTATQNNASGRYIVIQHGQQYTTKYLHLSAFANGVRAGKSVKQGQTIGYVGATGWATGPHLHYEFLVDSVHRNPRTVSLPKAEPISKDELNEFKAATAPVLARLNSVVGNTSYARAPDASDSGGE